MDDNLPDDEQMADLTGLSREQLRAYQADLATETARLQPDAAGKFAWDLWQERALAAGVGMELATRGRAVMAYSEHPCILQR